MVLESLISPFDAESHPKRMIVYGFIYMTIGLFLARWIFNAQASIVMVFLTTMACIPLMYNTIVREESKDLEGLGESWLLKEHGKALSFFTYLFIGVTIATAFWYVVLPAEQVSTIYQTQTSTIREMHGAVTGRFSESLSNATTHFSNIFFNNVKVLIFCILFSFMYGAGAIFILTWNATVVGTAIGNFVRSTFASYAHLLGFEKIAAYFTTTCVGLLRYSLHGIPEIMAYFTAGLAGGIISVAVFKHDYRTRKFEHILLDSADLLLISIGILFIAAVLEVFITPWFATNILPAACLGF